MNTEPSLPVIPTLEQERPIRRHGGFTFKNDALHCRLNHLFPAADLAEANEQWTKVMELYFANFCEPVRNLANEIHCVACNAKLTGPYGLADWRTVGAVLLDETSPTLEGRCTNCAYPLRARHILHMPSGELLLKLEWIPLLYHPSTLQSR